MKSILIVNFRKINRIHIKYWFRGVCCSTLIFMKINVFNIDLKSYNSTSISNIILFKMNLECRYWYSTSTLIVSLFNINLEELSLYQWSTLIWNISMFEINLEHINIWHQFGTYTYRCSTSIWNIKLIFNINLEHNINVIYWFGGIHIMDV